MANSEAFNIQEFFIRHTMLSDRYYYSSHLIEEETEAPICRDWNTGRWQSHTWAWVSGASASPAWVFCAPGGCISLWKPQGSTLASFMYLSLWISPKGRTFLSSRTKIGVWSLGGTGQVMGPIQPMWGTHFCPYPYFREGNRFEVTSLTMAIVSCLLPTTSFCGTSRPKKLSQRPGPQAGGGEVPCVLLWWGEVPEQNLKSVPSGRKAGPRGLPAVPANYLPSQGGVSAGEGVCSESTASWNPCSPLTTR